MGSRTWIKIYCDKWLNGTIREETPEIRGIWVDLLVLAGSGKYGDSGEIKITDNVGFLDEQLADLLQISRQKWATIKKKLIETDRVIIKNNNIIAIKKWSKYQSEYDRQKVYRQLEDANNPTPENSNQKLQTKVTLESTAGERDKRIENETIEREDKEETKQEEGSVRFLKSINEVITLYQENVLLGATISEDVEVELKTMCGRYSPDWAYDAIREAIEQNHPDWRYIVGILRHWAKYGRKKR